MGESPQPHLMVLAQRVTIELLLCIFAFHVLIFRIQIMEKSLYKQTLTILKAKLIMHF